MQTLHVRVETVPGLPRERGTAYERVDDDGRVGETLVRWDGQHGAVVSPPDAVVFLSDPIEDHAPPRGKPLEGLMYGRTIKVR